MDSLDALFMRLSEGTLQALLENWERFEGITYRRPQPLETRWKIFLATTAVCDEKGTKKEARR